MNKMKILVTYAGVWKMDNGSSGMTLNYFMYTVFREVPECGNSGWL